MKRLSIVTRSLLLTATVILVVGCDRPPPQVTQVGYRGLAMEQLVNPRVAATANAYQVMPVSQIPPAEAGGAMAKDIYQNVKVLTDLNVAQFTRLMLNMTSWVAPEQGCNYCHSGADLASDDLYTKRVSRRMLEMTRKINDDWSSHVQGTGVTCYTCHRGMPQPAKVLHDDPGNAALASHAGDRKGQNTPSIDNGLTSLPLDSYLSLDKPIRIAATHPLPRSDQPGATLRSTEGTYGLMMYFSESLGVNCTFCHNSRAFSSWEQSPPQRTTAWHGIQMARELNLEYVLPLASELPADRLGKAGDGPKVGCATCHQGHGKPLLGAPMLEANPELKTASRQP